MIKVSLDGYYYNNNNNNINCIKIWTGKAKYGYKNLETMILFDYTSQILKGNIIFYHIYRNKNLSITKFFTFF